MLNSEFRRLMGYHTAKQKFAAFASRNAPSKRSAKHPTVGKILKSSRIIAMPTERQYTGVNNYRSLNPDFNGMHQAS